MKFIEPSVTLLEKPKDQTNEIEVLKYIERIGRVCYRSEDHITDDSALKFFLMLKNRRHWAMLEHFRFAIWVNGDVVQLIKELKDINQFIDLSNSCGCNKYDFVKMLISPRSIYDFFERLPEKSRLPVEASELMDRIICELHNTWPTIFPFEPKFMYYDNDEYIIIRKENKEDWFSLEFVTSRAIANEIVRHRVASYAQESTRYCNYSKDKFGNELTFIKTDFPELNDLDKQSLYMGTLKKIEDSYMGMINNGVSPQKARSILPCDLATKIVMTAGISEWEHFFKMRCAPDAHPDIQVIAKKARELIHERI